MKKVKVAPQKNDQILISKIKPLLLCLLLTSCIVNAPRNRNTTDGISNTSASVDVGYGRALHGNPFELTENYNLSPVYFDLATMLKSEPDFITYNQFLEGACEPNGTGSGYIYSCFQVLQNENASPLDPSDNKWAYLANTDEFLEVNTFWHIKRQLDRWQQTLLNGWNNRSSYISSYPNNLFSNYANWKNGDILKAYSHCDLEDNAYFSPSEFALCFGYNADYERVKYAQDPSIIYHELGHTFTHIAMNIRNVSNNPSLLDSERSELGYGTYDEAGSINEGISDYYVYYTTGGKMFGEWALDSFDIPYVITTAARPLTEEQEVHAPSVGTSQDSRLSYPRYLTYDPNQYHRIDGEPPQEFEDIHYAGQIASHYWVALTEDLMGQCNMSQSVASNAVMSLIVQTLAELGDLTATGADGYTDRINHSAAWASEWLRVNKPITFRSFFQTFAKYLHLIYNVGAQCGNTSYGIDRIEQLLDQYGLLLFKSYNEDGNSEPSGHGGPRTSVTVTNRIYTESTSKDLLIKDPRIGDDIYEAVVIDNRTSIQKTITNLESAGRIEQHSVLIPDDLHLNNSNFKINPGEIIGLAINLYNSSNTIMGGVQLLANNWDHVKNGKPCNTFEDNFPLSSEGAAGADDSSPAQPGDCGYITRDNGNTAIDEIAPVCLVQINQENATIWATQDKLIEKINGVEASDCLDPNEPESCFVRVIKGGDIAHYSKIDPGKTWSETLTYKGVGPTYQSSNLIFMEISPKIQPGTNVTCRFRARFTNCTDCYSDPDQNNDDFLDYEFSGDKPFKIINFQFTVNN